MEGSERPSYDHSEPSLEQELELAEASAGVARHYLDGEPIRAISDQQRKRSVAKDDLLRQYDALMVQLNALTKELKSTQTEQLALLDPELPSSKEFRERYGAPCFDGEGMFVDVDAICDGVKASVRSIHALVRITENEIRWASTEAVE